MRLEVGDWTVETEQWRPEGQRRQKRFEQRIYIPREDFERLQDGEFEQSDLLTPYVSWLHDEVGSPFVGDWFIDFNFGYRRVYIRHHADAVMFLLRWGA